MSVVIHPLTNGAWKQHCYLVHNAAREALIIDPGSEAQRIEDYLRQNALNPLAILNTHAHYDHVGAVSPLKQAFGIPFYLHSQEVRLLKSANFFRKIFDSEEFVKIPEVDYFWDKLPHQVDFASFSLEILFTPGHTPGGVCLKLAEHLFTGDTLFHSQIGRTDLPGGNKPQLYASLLQLARLPLSTKLYPGHGRPSTLEEVFRHNPEFLEALREDESR